MPLVETTIAPDEGLPKWKQGACVLVLGAKNRTSSIKVLMTQRRDGSGWTLPGGKPESGERAEQAALREVFEETGRVLLPQNIRHLYSGVEISGWVTTCFYYTEKFYGIDLTIKTKEGEPPYKWGEWEELFEGPFSDFSRRVFEQARL